MIRTLKTYLAKDLAKVTALATVAFTLVMTIFAIIEPLRERGLSSPQALKLFGFSMPVMFSLTLPIAALFAATIVYGRFSQDNEMMAARASGIRTLSLLTPAIWLGLTVSVVTLTLGLYVAPRLLWLSQYTVRSNLRHIAFHALRTKGRLEFSGRLLHADRVDPDSGWMQGVVALDTSDREDAVYLVASKAKLDFFERDQQTFVVFDPVNWVARRQSGRTVLMLERERVQRGELPNPFEDEPKLYDWSKLCRYNAHPEQSPLVQEEVRKILRKICMHTFYEELVGAIRTQGKYTQPRGLAAPGEDEASGLVEIEVKNRSAVTDGRRVVLGRLGAGAQAPEADQSAVIVRQLYGARLQYSGREAEVEVEWDDFAKANLITVTLRDVVIGSVDEPESIAAGDAGAPPAPPAKDKEEVGPYAVPDRIVRVCEEIDLGELRAQAGSYSFGKQVVAMLDRLDRQVIGRLRSKIVAEIHLRLAYGASCMLMVMMGAALGLLFRGGQMLVAFAISAVPALLVIVMLFMGKELIKSPGVPEAYGIAAVWGGVAALAAATAYVYLVPMRR